MRLFLNAKHNLRLTHFLYTLFCVSLFSCDEKPPILRKNIEVVFTDFPSYICDESGNLSADGRSLFDELVSEDVKCKYTYILDPVLNRPDLILQHSIVTKIENSGVSDVNNPNVVVKLVKKNLEELTIPKPILQKSSLGADSSLNNYVLNEIKEDSVIVFAKDSKTDLTLADGKRYRTFSDIGEIRSKIVSILCQNPKASITLLINPPNIEMVPKGYKAGPPISIKNIQPPTKEVEVVKGPVARRQLRKPRAQSDNGDLTIVKGSEGCDICTRYYSATDNLGRVRQVTQRNSTECCPCGQTIEMRGRTYRMECNGSGGNKLALVE